MGEVVKRRAYKRIPTKLTEKEFNEFILPHLSKGSRGPQPKISLYKYFCYIQDVLYTGMQWKSLVIEKDENGVPEIHYSRIQSRHQRWSMDGSLEKVFEESVIRLKKHSLLDVSILHGDGTTTAAKKGGDCVGYSGHKHCKGEKIVAISDRCGNVISPFTVAAGNRNECVLFPHALKHLSKMFKLLSLSLKGIVMSLDAIYDSMKNRKMIFNRKMIPNIKENKRNRKKKKRGPKRFFSEAIFLERFFTVERTFAWEDKFKRLLLRFEHKSKNHFGMKLMAYTLINLRHFCSA